MPTLTQPKPRAKAKKAKKNARRPIARILRAENLWIHLRGRAEELRASNRPDAPKRLAKILRLMEKCRVVAPASIAEFEKSWS